MPEQVEIIYDICDSLHEEYKDRIDKLFGELGKELVKRLKEANIPLTETSGKNTRCDSKQKLMAEDRLLSLCQRIELTFRFSCLGEM